MHTFFIGLTLGVTGVLLWPVSAPLAVLTVTAGAVAALISSD